MKQNLVRDPELFEKVPGSGQWFVRYIDGNGRKQLMKVGREESDRGIYERNRGSGIWWIRYSLADGSIRREKVGNKSAARDLYQKRQAEVRAGAKMPENVRRKPILFSELAKDALEWSAAHKNDVRNDKSRMKYVQEEFGDRVAESITPKEIDDWLTHQDIEDSTRNRNKALISMVYRQGNRNGKITVNPARLVAARREHNARIRWLRNDKESNEEKKLRDAIRELCPERMPELDLGLYTGIRQSVQMALEPEFFDLKRKRMDIPKELMKNNEGLHVPLTDEALAAVKALMTRNPGSFLCPEHPRWWFESVLKKSGVKGFRWHDLRHTFISRLVMSGVDLRTVQQLAGHKTIAITVRYAHLSPDHLRAAIDRLGEKFPAEDRNATDTATSTSDFRGSKRRKRAKQKRSGKAIILNN
jgi:integrase